MNLPVDLWYGGLLLVRLTSHRLMTIVQRGMKAHRALHWRNMVAFHEEMGLLATIPGETVFRN